MGKFWKIRLQVSIQMPGPDLDLFWVWYSDTARFSKNYVKLYFDAKHIEKGLYRS